MKMKSNSKQAFEKLDPEAARRCQMKSLGLLALRLVFLLFMLHGIQKLMGIDGTAKFFGSLGIPMPTEMAWFVALLETFGGLALALGLFTEYFAPLVAIDMLVAFATAHLPSVMAAGLPFGLFKGELALLYLFAALAIWLCGPGGYSLKRCLGWGCQMKK